MASSRLLKKIKYALRILPDKTYIQLYYFARFHRFCDLKNPGTFNEKLQWLKLYDRRPEYNRLVDKYEVKKFVSDLIGEEYVIRTLGVWDNFDQIDFDALPERFVLKCTHDSEGIVIVQDKSKFDRVAAKEKLEACLSQNFYYIGREWPYKDVKPRIIAEEYLEDETDKELRDYKFFAFDGNVRAMYIASGRFSPSGTCFDFFDMDFNHLPFENGHPNAKNVPHKPKNFELMKKLAEKISRGFANARIDFYEVNGKVYFGEITFFHMSGFSPFKPEKWDRTFGDWLSLPDKTKSGK